MPDSSEKSTAAFRPDTLLASVFVLLVVNVVQRSIGFGRGLLFCRWLDPDALGHWDMAYGFLLLAAPVAVFGLPGSFGRYLERYRQRGQLKTFLIRTGLWTGGFGLAAIALLIVFRMQFAYLVFGDSEQQLLLILVAATLAAVILHHFLEAVFAGIRVFRVVSAMHFAQSMLFAAISLALLSAWRADASSIIIGYGGACLLSAVGVLLWSRRYQWDSIEEAVADSHSTFWPPLLRFAIWVWVTNLLSNLFTIIDRYMLVHYSSLSPEESLALVGHYHTSMLLPVLLVSVANLLTGAITPHLSHGWEQGDRQGVSAQLNLTFKLTVFGMLACGIGVLIVAPRLFAIAFDDKYAEGLAVLPWALSSCIWFGMLLVAQTYAWCAEKTRQATIPLAIGLISNIVLNLILLPMLGLQGAVMATALSTLLAVFAQLLVNSKLGMTNIKQSMLVALVPFGLTQGITVAIAFACVLLIGTCATSWILSREERGVIMTLVHQRLSRWFPNIADRISPEEMRHA